MNRIHLRPFAAPTVRALRKESLKIKLQLRKVKFPGQALMKETEIPSGKTEPTEKKTARRFASQNGTESALELCIDFRRRVVR